MNAGQLRHRVSIIAPPNGSSLDSRGQLSGSNTTLASSIPALVEEVTPSEPTMAHQVYATASHRVTIYRDSQIALTEKCWLTFGSQRLNIVGILKDGIDVWLSLACQEVRA